MKAGRGQRLRQVHGRARGAPRRRCGALSSARRRALVVCGVLVDGAECGRLDGTGGKSVGGRAGEALMAEQRARRCSGAASSGARVPCRACREEERGRERKRVERERERSTF